MPLYEKLVPRVGQNSTGSKMMKKLERESKNSHHENLKQKEKLEK